MNRYDFSGYATKNDIVCGDGRIIRKDAFKDNDGTTVPLVWQHIHNDPLNVLGHAELENRSDGVYAYCSFNDTIAGQNAKSLVQHGDVTSMSIYANKLQQQGNSVLHGLIREVSLVLAGANPGATIDPLSIAHGDGTYTDLDDEAIIRLNLPLELSHADTEDDEEEAEAQKETKTMTKDSSERTVQDVLDTFTEDEKKVLQYMVGLAISGDAEQSQASEDVKHSDDKGATVQDVLDGMSEEKKNVLYYLVGLALEDAKAQHSDAGNSNELYYDGMGDSNMHRNVFDTNDPSTDVLTHDDMDEIFTDARRSGSLKDAFLAHGIENLEILFPEAKSVTPTPEMIGRETSWVAPVWGAFKKTPFARIKSTAANITEYEARARGYITGNQKIEEVFSLLARITTPQTVYKLQKLDRDDIIDITDIDVVAWMRGEMRGMLEEEITAACLVGDGRPATDVSKIHETNIRPIYQDDDLYTIHENVTLGSSLTFSQLAEALIVAALLSRKNYKGSGSPWLFASNDVITRMLLATDQIGRRLYPDMNALATALRVDRIVEVPILEGITRTATVTANGGGTTTEIRKLLMLIVNPSDYVVGADKGGAVNMFDDFDLDFNKYEYLIETRCSGALVKPKSAIAIETTSELPFDFGVRPGDFSTATKTKDSIGWPEGYPLYGQTGATGATGSTGA